VIKDSTGKKIVETPLKSFSEIFDNHKEEIQQVAKDFIRKARYIEEERDF
jgi:hypothetical protein